MNDKIEKNNILKKFATKKIASVRILKEDRVVNKSIVSTKKGCSGCSRRKRLKHGRS